MTEKLVRDNQVFEEDTSPWQYVLNIVQTRPSAEDFSVEAEDPESYFRVDGIRPQTSCSTYLGSLFELMLKYGGDSYARVTEPVPGNSKSLSVFEIISCSLATSPMDVAFLVELLPKPSLLPDLPLPSDPSLSDLPLPSPKSRESRLSRFKLKVRIRQMQLRSRT
jgi:hypothetical protein